MEFNNPLLRIVWEDDDLIVINKREGLLSVSTDRIKERTAYRILSDYLKECDPRNKIFVLHRLDRDTSGIMMFAKNQKVKEQLQSNWSEAITQRTYVAVIGGTAGERHGFDRIQPRGEQAYASVRDTRW